MRIICDSEEEKEKIYKMLIGRTANQCPSYLGFKNPEECEELTISCKECWEQTGIFVVVAPERRKLKEPTTFDETIHNLYDSGFNECWDMIFGNKEDKEND